MLDAACAAVRSRGDPPDWERRRVRRSRILVRGRRGRGGSLRDAPRTRVSCGAPAGFRRRTGIRLDDSRTRPMHRSAPRPAAISSAPGAQHVLDQLATPWPVVPAVRLTARNRKWTSVVQPAPANRLRVVSACSCAVGKPSAKTPTHLSRVGARFSSRRTDLPDQEPDRIWIFAARSRRRTVALRKVGL